MKLQVFVVKLKDNENNSHEIIYNRKHNHNEMTTQ